jgi:DNA processing protein
MRCKMNELMYCIALSLVDDIGPSGARRLIAAFGSPRKVFDAPFNELLRVEGIGPGRAGSVRKFSSWTEVEKIIRDMEKTGVSAVHLGERSFPGMLREVEDAPIVLYLRGTFHEHDKYALALVGSRKPSPYGLSITDRFTRELATMGFSIVSGMARGIDSCAHRAALAAGARTIGVLGSGPDVPYPPENRGLLEKIAVSGCVVSEFPPGTPPEKENFPRRNRLISGLSLGVIIVEATSGSGALITARSAVEQGREVFAVPGNATSALSAGPNELIRKGAVLARSSADILEELAPVLKGFIRAGDKVRIEITEEEKVLCDMLTAEPKQIDIISRETGVPASRALSILLGLELKGAVKQLTGKRFYLS